MTLVAGGGGDFIVTVDGTEHWHRKKMGKEFPEAAVLIQSLGG